MTSVEPVNGQIFYLRDLHNRQVPGFTHYYDYSKRPNAYLFDNSEYPTLHYYEYKKNDRIKNEGYSTYMSPNSEFEYKDGDYYPHKIITGDSSTPLIYDTTTPIPGTKYYQTITTDQSKSIGDPTKVPKQSAKYLSKYDTESRQFRPSIVTDDTLGRYRVLPSSEILQDDSNHFNTLRLMPVNEENYDRGHLPSPTFIRQDDGSYIKESSPSDDESDAIQHYDFNPDTNQLTKSKPNPLMPYEMIDNYVDQKIPSTRIYRSPEDAYADLTKPPKKSQSIKSSDMFSLDDQELSHFFPL